MLQRNYLVCGGLDARTQLGTLRSKGDHSPNVFQNGGKRFCGTCGVRVIFLALELIFMVSEVIYIIQQEGAYKGFIYVLRVFPIIDCKRYRRVLIREKLFL